MATQEKTVNEEKITDKYYHLDMHFSLTPPRFDDVFLIQIGRLYSKEDFETGDHMHLNWFELTIVRDGEGFISADNVDIPVSRGDIFLSFPAETHNIRTEKGKSLKYDYLSFYTVNESWNAELEQILNKFRNAHDRVFHSERISALVESAIAEFTHTDNDYREELLISIFHQILIYLLRAFKAKTATKAHVEVNQAEILCYQVMNYVDTHIFSLKSLHQVADVFTYNYSYLSTLFKKTTGRTLLDYYQDCKLKKAQSLVLERKLKITEIADHLNYTSVYAFSKAYKKKFGVCPTAAKKS